MSFIQSNSVASSTDYYYVNEDAIDPELKCSICQQPLLDPMIGKECGHAFCDSCISHWYTQNSSCPTCRKKATFKRLSNRIVLSQLDRILVGCSHCNEKDIQRGNFADHINHRCRQVRVKCKAADLKCSWTGKKEEQAQHSAACPLLQIQPIVQDLRAELSALSYQLQIFMSEMREQLNNSHQPTPPSRRQPRVQNQDDHNMSEKEHFDQLMSDMRYQWTRNHIAERGLRCAVCNYRDHGFLKCLVCARVVAPSYIRIHDAYRGQLTDVICTVCANQYGDQRLAKQTFVTLSRRFPLE